ncbi:MAG: LLM class flavin-dependent oxidoreductase [Nitrososphaerota archaeon]|nr:LLM class flavin-dependent oxidoreductase [Nitrososphaerota archaeon]
MKFGVALPTSRDGLMYHPGFCNRDSMVQMTRLAEELGFESVWGNDHITTQAYLKQVRPLPNYYEVLTSLSYLAAVTNRIRLGTGIVPLPLRNPVILAKQSATLDNLSGGRHVLGVGIGAYREEFESIMGNGRRGDIFTEGLEAMKKLFEENDASYSGKYVRFHGIDLNPKPIQKPFPIYIGGNSHDHLRRIAKYGGGWLPAAMPVDQLAKFVEELKALIREEHRSMSEIDVAMETGLAVASSDDEAKKQFARSPMYKHLQSLKGSTLKDLDVSSSDRIFEVNFVGRPESLVRKVERYSASGATTLWFDFVGDSLEEVTSGMKRFAGDVMSSF